MTHQETRAHHQRHTGMCPVKRDLFVIVIQADLDRKAAGQQEQKRSRISRWVFLEWMQDNTNNLNFKMIQNGS